MEDRVVSLGGLSAFSRSRFGDVAGLGGRRRGTAIETELGTQLAQPALGLDVGRGLLDLEHPGLDGGLGELRVALALV